jgi:hypothetical protein
MASLLLHSFRPMMLGLGLGLSLASFQTLHQRAMRLDSGPIISGHSHRKNAQTPVLRTGQLNPNGVKQISTGSIIGNLTGNGQQMAAHEKKLGLCVGLAVSTFSRSLAILLGLLVVGLQVGQFTIMRLLDLDLIHRSGHQAMVSM